MKIFFQTIFFAVALFICGCQCQTAPEFSIAPSAETAQAQNQIKADFLFIEAMPSESKFIIEKYALKEIAPNLHAANGIACITTGIGKDGVNSTLKNFKISDKTKVFNVGYCGSNVIEKGKLCKVGSVAKIESPAACAKIAESGVPCYSSDKFVEETSITKPCVFDMELFYLQKKFPNIVSYKIVSDNLSHSEFKDFESLNPKDAWDNFFKEISSEIPAKK